MARAEWKTALRANCSEEELYEQDLFDFLADCTVLVAQRDEILANWESDLEKSTSRRDKIKQRALSLLDDVSAWKKRWDRDSRNFQAELYPPFAKPQPTQSRGDRSPPFLAIFEFSNTAAAIELMFYNTILIYGHRILASLPSDNLDTHSDQSSIQDTSQDAEYINGLRTHTKDEWVAAERFAALDICRCIPHYLERRWRSDYECSPIVHWAVTTAWVTVRGNESAEGRWMNSLNTEDREVIPKGLWAG